MNKYRRLKTRVLSGAADRNVRFSDLCKLLVYLGFQERIKGDHHIFTHEHVDEIINIQPENDKAKAYQVRQIRKILNHYGLDEPDVL